MHTYVSLVKYSDQEVAHTTESPKRLEAAKKIIKALGGELQDFYLTLGTYDIIAIIEAPNDEVVDKFLRALGPAGRVRANTLKVVLHGRVMPTGVASLLGGVA